MKYILITGHQVADEWLYEHRGQQGRRVRVPTYLAEMGDDACPELRHHFAVTRDSSAIVFGERKRRWHIRMGECPPHRTCAPYEGRRYEHPKIGTVLRIAEASSPDTTTLWGTRTLVRRHIMLHGGPARSEGCFCIAGGKPAHLTWGRLLKTILPTEDETMVVFVEPRPQAHHDIHLAR